MTAPIGRPPRPLPTVPTSSTAHGSSAQGTSAPVATPASPAAGWGPGGVKQHAVTATAAKLTETLKSAGPSDFDLVPGRYPDAVPLPALLNAMGTTPQGQAALNKVLDGLKAKTGVDVPPELRAAAMSNPAALTKAFEITPGQLSAGVVALNAAYQAGKVKDPAPPAQLLPQKFDLANLASLDAPRPKGELKELAPGLLQGDLPSALPDAQVKQNRVMAEVFDRLSKNPEVAAGAQFEVTYNGKPFTKVDDFIGALKADGYQVDVRFDSRVANFADLKTTVPGSNPPKYVDVPAPLMVKTGVRDALGHEAVVPATHSEMVVCLKAGPNTKGPKVDADVKFFQGMSGTGFFPANVWADPSWCGKTTTATLSGDQAMAAVKFAGAYTQLVDTAAKKEHLYADGYGMTGVCNDSVAVVEQAVTGKATQYPLLMKDDLLLGTIKQHLADPANTDDATWQALGKAIKQLPSDTRVTNSTKQRALASMPWAAGKEPFASSEAARKILSQ